MTSEIRKNAEVKMQKSLEKFKLDLTKLRTGRAHIGILDHVLVDYYGSPVPVGQISNVIASDARTLTVQPWEANMVSAVEKAIRESDLGLNPAVNGQLIRIPMPLLTEERRKELIKVVKSEAESAKVVVRNVRRDANDSLKTRLKDKLITEDLEKRGQDDIQKMTDKYIQEIDKASREKEQDLLTV
jgi:ribosome recycling factor